MRSTPALIDPDVIGPCQIYASPVMGEEAVLASYAARSTAFFRSS